jgi:hypothetical protein
MMKGRERERNVQASCHCIGSILAGALQAEVSDSYGTWLGGKFGDTKFMELKTY